MTAIGMASRVIKVFAYPRGRDHMVRQEARNIQGSVLLKQQLHGN
jgi:hypothetical protein